MEYFLNVYELIDKLIMPVYRFTGNALTGYYLGTFVLAFASMIAGEYSIAFAYRVNKGMIRKDNARINHFQELSFEALKSGNRAAFKACNSIANEAYGKSFFTQITLSAACLWPLFIALGWMQYRFAEVEFSVPLTGWTTGYFFTFLLCYITARIISGKIRQKMHYMSQCLTFSR